MLLLIVFIFCYIVARRLYIVASICFAILCVGVLLFTPPVSSNVIYPQVFVVSEGENIREVAESLQKERIVSSASLFVLANYALGGKILWGSYYFSEPVSIFALAERMYTGTKDYPFKKITIPEGSNAYEIADIFGKHFPNFNKEDFEKTALREHGYLYPDTYFLANDDARTDTLIQVMKKTFNLRTADLFDSYKGNLTKDEIVTLASIVELEAYRKEDRRKIASVLFNRLAADLRLQVDVSFRFISGKHTFQLSRSDLKVDDPSNTYKYKGIPPVPIGNPSRDAIEAVLKPIPSDNLYFLADKDGVTYFSKTYEEHLRKKAKYVDSRQLK